MDQSDTKGKRGYRLNPRHQEMVRSKIRASSIVYRLSKCVHGKLEMTKTQVAAAKILLDKSIPNLSSTEHSGEIKHTLESLVALAARLASDEHAEDRSRPN